MTGKERNMVEALRDKHRSRYHKSSSSYRGEERRDDHSRKHEKERKEGSHHSRSPKGKADEQPLSRKDSTLVPKDTLPPPPKALPPPTSRPAPASLGTGKKDRLDLQRSGKATVLPVEQQESQEAAANKAQMEKLRRDFPNLYLQDGFWFPPKIKKIPDDITGNIANYVHDIAFQYKEWVKTAETISKVAFQKQEEIHDLKKQLERSENILATTQKERDEQFESQRQTAQDVSRLEGEIMSLKQEHLDKEQILHSRNHDISKERDQLRIDLSASQSEVENLKKELTRLTEERDLARKECREAKEDLGREKIARQTAEEGATKLDKEMSELLVMYNANVLEYRGLDWLGEDYPFQLYNAWLYFVNERRESDPTIDEFALEVAYLSEEERRILHDFQIKQIRKDKDVPHNVGESSGSKPDDDPPTSSLPLQTSTALILPSQEVPGYDPTSPGLSISLSQGMATGGGDMGSQDTTSSIDIESEFP